MAELNRYKSSSKLNRLNMGEKDLVRMAKGDYAYFAMLYEKYFPKIYKYAFSILRRHDAAEDVVSETFEKALMNLGSYEDRGYSFGAWLYRIARNAALDHLQRQKPLTHYDSETVLTVNSTSAEDSAAEQILRQQLWTELLKLDLATREILVLRYIEGYSIKEVAAMTSKTEDSIKSLAKRAIKRLKLNLNIKENEAKL